jgi:4-diphosphocytidyl-2-C-methyl-D-erythritol kinase
MITFPNAKINIGLNIVGCRADGYHDLETVFYPIPLEDALEIVPVPSEKSLEQQTKCHLHCYGNPIEGKEEDNLVVKAYHLLDADFHLPAVSISLFKHIPSEAGLGGGSSDATYTLKMLNELFNLNLSASQLKSYAVKLGADCPFFVDNVPALAKGIGEQLTPINFSLKGYHLLLVKPEISISTREAFDGIIPRKPNIPVEKSIFCPIGQWKDTIQNDFEKSVFPQHGSLEEIKNRLYREGALFASMSGSGSTLYGIFKKGSIPTVNGFNDMFCFSEAFP